MKSPRIEIQEYSISKLFTLLAEKRFAVPEVQREFVWDAKKACKLLDSIYHELPIGTVMIWETHGKNRYHLREHLHVLPEFDGSNRLIWYLLDGQQRISVLYQSQKGQFIQVSGKKQINFGHICLNLETNDSKSLFGYRRPIPGKFVSLSDILAHDWRRRLYNLPAYKIRTVEKCRKRIRSYKIPMLFLRTNDLDEVREVFIRINSLGTPVSAADRAFARASQLNMRHLVRQAKSGLADGFKDLPDSALLLAMAFACGERTDVGERPIQMAIKKLEMDVRKNRDAKKAFTKKWEKLRAALGKAIDYIRGNFCVINRGFLPSDNMLVVLTMFFYWNGAQPNAIQKKEIRKWFWATAVCKRYSGRGHRANILKDLIYFENLAHKHTVRFVLETKARMAEIRNVEYTTRGSLTNAFFCLLLKQTPRFIENGDSIPLENISARANRNQKHHIFPQTRLKGIKFSLRDCNSLCNICFIVAEENQSIGKRFPSDYLREAASFRNFDRVMRSHLIPVDKGSGVWDQNAKNGYKKFLKSRLSLICCAFEREAGIKLFENN